MTYRVVHRTEYSYPSTVSSSYGEVVMLPREQAGQQCLSSSLVISPEPTDLRERLDFFGNRTTYFAVLAPHTELTVTATSVVRVRGRAAAVERAAHPADSIGWWPARDRVQAAVGSGPNAEPDALDARQYVLGSPLVELSDELREYAAASFRTGAGLLDAAMSLSSRIHRDFEYLPGVTEVTSTIAEVLDHRAGVCQDFAHVAIGCLRSLGLAARYVSGYLETQPPPGQQKLLGSDASHAWFSVFVPGIGWIDLDPTNDQPVDDRYVTTAWGRDYTDVPPVKGVIFTRGDRQVLRVSVDVLRLDPADDPADAPSEPDERGTPTT